MARRSQNGCGALLAVGAVILVISRCAATVPTVPRNPAPFGHGNSMSESPRANVRFVASQTLNCRADPRSRARIVTSLSRGDPVTVEATEGRWSRINSLAGTCWVSTNLLSRLMPARERSEVLPVYSLPPTPRRERGRQSGSFQCGLKRVCGQMNSCAEANYYLNECGLSRLDRDNDGVPCESICR